MKGQTLCRYRLRQVGNNAGGLRVFRVNEVRNGFGPWKPLSYDLKPFCRQAGGEEAHSGQVAARTGEAGDLARTDRIAPNTDTIGIVSVAFVAAATQTSPPPVASTSTLRATKSAASAGNRS